MKRIHILPLLLLIAAILFPAISNAQIFYKIEGNGLQKPSYLFGTHHFAPDSILNSMPQVHRAMKEVKCVVGEIDMSEGPAAIMQQMQSHIMAPADSTLSALLPADRFAELDSVFASLTGFPLKMMDGMKPAMAETTLMGMVAAREMPQAGQLDSRFQMMARAYSLEVAGLETADFQGHVLFDIVPLKLQAQMLVNTLENPDEILRQTRALTDAYLSRDAETLWKVGQEGARDTEGEFFEILLARRNENWLQKLPSMMEEKPLFVAVGALHLYGDEGLINGLRKMGYTVTPIL